MILILITFNGSDNFLNRSPGDAKSPSSGQVLRILHHQTSDLMKVTHLFTVNRVDLISR
jgi:hypothetical protein